MKIFHRQGGIRWFLLACLLVGSHAFASDGDLVYSAPYIMVDPDTGQVVTVNPGPRLKAHPAPAESGQQSGVNPADVKAGIAAAPTGGEPEAVVTPGEADTTPAIIALWGSLFFVVAGYWLSRRTKIHNISTESRHGNH